MQDDSIATARQAALDLLRPSPRDLEHGLDLHAAALVVDAYGFAPRASPDPAMLAAAAARGAGPQEIRDLGQEHAASRVVHVPAQQAEFEAAWQHAGVTCILQNAGEEGNDPTRVLRRLGPYTWLTDQLPALLRRVLNPAQIRAAKAEGRRCLYLTANGVPLTGRQERTTEELGLMQRGRSDAEILKILGENVLRVAEATLQAGSGGAE